MIWSWKQMPVSILFIYGLWGKMHDWEGCL